jgi:hypothetical protein
MHLNSRGTKCTMKTLAHSGDTNTALIGLVKEVVLSPEMVKLFAAEVDAESRRESTQPKATAAGIKKKLKEAEKEISNLVDAIASYGLRDNIDIQRKLKQATDKRDAATADLASLEDATGGGASAAITATAADLNGMLDALMAGAVDQATMYKARLLLAELVDPFEAHPHPDGTEFRAKLRRFATTPGNFTVSPRRGKFVGNLVAGAGFEPATFGL